MPEMACLILIFYFCIGNGCVTYRTPVDDSCTLVNPAFFMHFTENFRNSLVAAFIHGKTLSVPVAGRAQFFQLGNDTSAVLFFPLPCALQKAFTTQIMLINSLFFQRFDNFYFCCDGSMVCTWLPKCIVSLHSLITDQNILHGIVQCMAHMQLSCDIWGWNHNGKWFLGMIYFGMEILLFQPFGISAILNVLGIISFC